MIDHITHNLYFIKLEKGNSFISREDSNSFGPGLGE